MKVLPEASGLLWLCSYSKYFAFPLVLMLFLLGKGLAVFISEQRGTCHGAEFDMEQGSLTFSPLVPVLLDKNRTPVDFRAKDPTGTGKGTGASFIITHNIPR